MALSQDSNSLLDTSALKALQGLKVAVVSTEWNEKIVAEQLAGFMRIASEFAVEVTHDVKVPGAFEIPFGCRIVAGDKANSPEAIVTFGAVIRGGTPHFDYVCKAVTEGITQLNITLGVPVIFGVLTLDNEVQAWERLGGSHGHKGEEAAIAALKMIALSRRYK